MTQAQKSVSSFAALSALVLVAAWISISLSRQVGDIAGAELAMEQELRKVEVSIWKAVHAADGYRATADPKYSALYFEQLAEVGQSFQAYTRLIDRPIESAGANEFRQHWHQATDAGRILMTTVRDRRETNDQLHPTGPSPDDRAVVAYGAFVDAVNSTARVLDARLNGYVQTRLETRAELARFKRIASAAAGLLALIGFIVFGLFTVRTSAGPGQAEILKQVPPGDNEERASHQTEFISTVSREIRAPLNGVLRMAELLGMTQLDDVQRELVVDINHSADALLDVINDILDFTTIDTGQMTLHADPFDLEVLTHEVCHLLAHSTEATNLELILDYSADCPRQFKGDAGRVRQILVNLVGNGLKFTGDGHVLLEVSCRETSAGQATISMAIQDTGIGTDSRAFGGTGLGLALTKQLVDAMGGSVRLESTSGGGSTFTVVLPLVLEKAPPLEKVAELRGLPVLLACGHVVNRRVLQRALESTGLRVDSVADQFEAMRLLTRAASEGKPYQLLVVDEPASSHGGRLLAAILDNAIFADIPVISVVSPRRQGGQDASRVAGCVQKPILSEDLRETVANVIQGRATRPAGNPAGTRLSEVPPGQKSPAKGHILVVEDNPVNQMLAGMLLRKLGFEVSAVVDGRQAVEYLAKSSADLVFMDCQMPVMDGYQATAAIREMESHQGGRVPILALTADASEVNRKACLDSGMDDFLTKPCSSGNFEKALELWLPARADRRAVPPSGRRGGVSRGINQPS